MLTPEEFKENLLYFNSDVALLKRYYKNKDIVIKGNLDLSNNKVATITSGNYKIVYNDITYNSNLFLSSSYLQESLGLSGEKQYKKFSYANIIYKNINTFTGKDVFDCITCFFKVIAVFS